MPHPFSVYSNFCIVVFKFYTLIQFVYTEIVFYNLLYIVCVYMCLTYDYSNDDVYYLNDNFCHWFTFSLSKKHC